MYGIAALAGASPLLDAEKESWLAHNLIFDERYRALALDLLSNFKSGSELSLSCSDRRRAGCSYKHCFVTNGTWIFEFNTTSEDSSIYGARVLIRRVNEAAGELRHAASLQGPFLMDDAIRNRMRQLVGLKNYSLCLRNCEHVARYVLTGRWVSLQLNEGGALFEFFRSAFVEDVRKLLNAMPHTLVRTPQWIAGDGKSQLAYKATEPFLRQHEETYNVLVVGPRSSGKTSLIRSLFCGPPARLRAEPDGNAESSSDTAIEPTSDVSFFRGCTKVASNDQDVILIDTVGFADPKFQDRDLLAVMKRRVMANTRRIHHVIGVVSYLETAAESFEGVALVGKWLRAHCHKSSFVILVNKAEAVQTAEEEDRVRAYLNSVAQHVLGYQWSAQQILFYDCLSDSDAALKRRQALQQSLFGQVTSPMVLED